MKRRLVPPASRSQWALTMLLLVCLLGVYSGHLFHT